MHQRHTALSISDTPVLATAMMLAIQEPFMI
jgi:hypothetical protein